MSAKEITLGLWLRTAPVKCLRPRLCSTLRATGSMFLLEFFPEGSLVDLVGMAWFIGMEGDIAEIYRL